MTSTNDSGGSLLAPEDVARHRDAIGTLVNGLRTVLLGQEDVVDAATICLLGRGHLLLEGLPGLGKTELVKGLSRLLSLEFSRVQFTPDLLPTDITGAHVLEDGEGGRTFTFRRGPIFANLVLADEINRASPKTQAAMLEAMQEHRVTLLGATHDLPRPFFVLATQNPIELEGTYPLPEAQLDRFTFKVDVGGVGPDVLTEIVTDRILGRVPDLEPVLDAVGLQTLFDAVDRVHMPRPVAGYIARLTTAINPSRPECPASVKELVRYGASPRAAIAMASTSKAAALLAGKPNVGFEDVDRVALPVLRHRVIPSYQAGLEGVTTDDIVARVLEATHELGRMPSEVGD